MAARPTLLDLYKRGEEATITGVVNGQQVEIKVWLQKLSPTDHAKATRSASAARARLLACAYDTDSEEYLAVKDDVYKMGDDRAPLVDYLLIDEGDKIRMSAEAEVAAEDEWSEENYLDGLRDSWVETLAERYAQDPEDPEAKKVLEELTRFADAVAAKVQPELDDLRASYEHTPIPELQDEVVKQVIKNRGVNVWLLEFYRQQMFFGTRRIEDHAKRYFNSFDEVDVVETPVKVQLQAAFEDLSVDATEGKGSEEIPSSSDSSEPSGQPATVVSSGRADAPL